MNASTCTTSEAVQAFLEEQLEVKVNQMNRYFSRVSDSPSRDREVFNLQMRDLSITINRLLTCIDTEHIRNNSGVPTEFILGILNQSCGESQLFFLLQKWSRRYECWRMT